MKIEKMEVHHVCSSTMFNLFKNCSAQCNPLVLMPRRGSKRAARLHSLGSDEVTLAPVGRLAHVLTEHSHPHQALGGKKRNRHLVRMGYLGQTASPTAS